MSQAYVKRAPIDITCEGDTVWWIMGDYNKFRTVQEEQSKTSNKNQKVVEYQSMGKANTADHSTALENSINGGSDDWGDA